MGCLVSTSKDSGEIRGKQGRIGKVSVHVPSLRIPKPVDFALQLGDYLTKNIVERLSTLRTRVVVMAGQEGPTITRTKRKSTTTHHGGSTLKSLSTGTTMSSAWYVVLSVLHLMSILLLLQAIFLVLPRSSTDGYQLN